MRTRFAPSPTGYLHIGGARTALYSWLVAKKNGGKFVLRIEDTDRERSTDESVQAILDGMEWLGLDYDEGPIYQTHRFDRYKELIQKLLDEGKAYYCYCTKEELDELREQQMANKEKPRYDGRWRDAPADKPKPDGVEPVVRFKNPLEGEVVFDDLARGEIRVSNAELDDLIIARGDGTPTYNFTVVVDDIDMEISHVIRGDDHINNTPRQINIMQALGFEPPVFAHAPMILGADGARLSKRHGAVSVMQYSDEGFLPEALLNYLVRLGWSHGDQELFSVEEMIELFDVKDINRAPSTFNNDKLRWINHQYIMAADPARLVEPLTALCAKAELNLDNGPALLDVIPPFAERSETLVDMVAGIRFLYEDFDEFDAGAAKKHLKVSTKEVLEALRDAFTAIDGWEGEALQALVGETAEKLELKMGKVGMPLRVAVTGNGASPSLDVTLALLGRERVVARLGQAIAYVEARAENPRG